jgi:excisionase family DNA binding protein
MNASDSVRLTPATSAKAGSFPTTLTPPAATLSRSRERGEERSEPSAEPPCVTRFELAELLRVSVRTVDRMIAAGEIPVRRVRGRAVRFLRSDVEQYLNGGAR